MSESLTNKVLELVSNLVVHSSINMRPTGATQHNELQASANMMLDLLQTIFEQEKYAR